MTEEEKAAVEKARQARLSAYRNLHSDPSPETKEAYREANRIFQAVSYQLDPEYRAMKKKAYAEWRERKKLGIPGPRSKSKL